MRVTRMALASLIVFGGLLTTRESNAAISGVVYSSVTGHYYKIYQTLSTWSSAKTAAQSVGGYLACITSSAENSWILQQSGFASNTPWIGGTDETVEGTWTWVSGETWSYTNWGSGEPNNSGNEDYTTFRTDGFWNDWTSTGTAYYIVEWNTDPNLPADPANLRATNVTQTRVDLAWDDLSNSELNFELEKALGNGSFAPLAQPAVDVTTYADTNVTAETLYRYRVRAVNAAGASGYSNILSVASAPPPPTGATANALSATSVQVGWTDNSSAETGFEVERGNGSPGQNFAALGAVGSNTTTYLDTTAAPETRYSYRIRAAGAGGKSTWSAEASVLTPLASPTGVTLAAPVDTSVDLEWEDRSLTETGYEIQRGLGCPTASFTTIATVGANVTDFTDGTVLPQRTYSYRMRTVNDGGTSAWSAEKCVTTPPYAPTQAGATATSANRVHLTWTSNTTIAQSQQIERALASTGVFLPLATVLGNVTQYDDTTAGQETSYLYRVAAVGTAGRSGWSVTSQVDAPAVLVIRKAAVAHGKGAAKLTVTGEFDVGGRGVDLAAAASFGVGQAQVAVPSFVRKGKGYLYTAPGLKAQLKPGTGSSRVGFVLQVDETHAAMPEADGVLEISYTNGAFRAVGSVRLDDDAFKPPSRGQYVDPPFSLVAVTASLKDGAKDTLAIKAAFRGGAPSPDLHLKFGNYDVRIPIGDFTQSGDKWLLREKGVASRSITFDNAKGTVSIVLKGIELGSHPSGPDPVRVVIEFSGVYFEDTPQMAGTGKTVKY